MPLVLYHAIVYGVDEFASAEALVSALLEDPFATEQEVEAVKQRWDGRDDKVVIEYVHVNLLLSLTDNSIKIRFRFLWHRELLQRQRCRY